jgi:GTP pyrophosphokinase
MQTGTRNAKILKLADRISNLTALGFVNDVGFVKRYIRETRECILPYATAVNANMFTELSDLCDNRQELVSVLEERARQAEA